MPITSQLRLLLEQRATLDLAQSTELMRQILAGHASDLEVAGLLSALAARGETAEELAGFALALRETSITLPLQPEEQAVLVDTCGTGGDGHGTFNISTAAALVAAAAGASVAKHGNRAVTSRCGSADVLEALGIPVGLEPAAAADELRAHGFVFLLAPNHHPALRALMPVRKALGVRTLLHVMGPMLNPAGARRQVMGVYAARLVDLVAEAMTHLNVEHALVVHGEGGLDELALSGSTSIAEVKRGIGETPVVRYQLEATDVGLASAPVSALQGGDALENARILRSIFSGELGPRRDIVTLNAAAVLMAAGKASTLRDGVRMAQEAISFGAVQDRLARLTGR